MPRSDEPTKPMTLGNMRSLGVRSLFATCLACGSKTEVNIDAWPDDVPVPSFTRHMRCTGCGKSRRQCDTELDRAGQQLAGDGAMSVTADQLRPLQLLASSRRLLAGLGRGGLAAAKREVVKAGG